jgi:mono/diheme cytochrome c family protein
MYLRILSFMLRPAGLFTAIIFTSCLQTENSSSLDAETYGSAWREIVGTHCGSCHVFHTLDDATLVTAGLVTPGDPDNSKLYYRLSGSSGSNGPKNMPTGGSLSAEDIAKIHDYIRALH